MSQYEFNNNEEEEEEQQIGSGLVSKLIDSLPFEVHIPKVSFLVHNSGCHM